MSASSKLTEFQWEEVAAFVVAGGTLRSASQHCKEAFGIDIKLQSIHCNNAVKEAIVKRRIIQRMEASESLQDTLPSVSKTIVQRMKGLAQEASDLHQYISDPRSCAYKTATTRLQQIDVALTAYMKPYRELMDWIQTDPEGSPRDENQAHSKAKGSAQDYMKTLDILLKNKDSSAN